MKINVITLFPELFEPFFERLPYRRAIENKELEVNLVDLKDFAIDERGTVDDKPYGGGVGMVLRIEPIFDALESVHGEFNGSFRSGNSEVIALSPSGKTYSQKKAQELSKKDEITLICGRYEGIDTRVKENLATDVISVGNYVLSGGEIPALAVIESIARLLPSAIEKDIATEDESFSEKYDESIEYPQYTRPEEFKGMRVPEVLLSGNHKEIEIWKENNRTSQTRED